MNTNNGNRDRENRQGAWWKYVVVGGSLTVAVYGIYKFLTKGQWKVKEIVPLTVGSASVAPVVGPKLGGLVRAIAKSLPIEKPSTSSYYSSVPQNPVISSRSVDIPVKQLEELAGKLERWADQIEKANQVTEPKIHHFDPSLTADVSMPH